MQLANMGRKVRVSKALWLGHVNVFVKITLKEGVFYVKFMNNPTLGDSKSKDNVNSGGLHNKTKSLSII